MTHKAVQYVTQVHAIMKRDINILNDIDMKNNDKFNKFCDLVMIDPTKVDRTCTFGIDANVLDIQSNVLDKMLSSYEKIDKNSVEYKACLFVLILSAIKGYKFD